ncbi:MAG TPA: hypothetical protein VHX59_27200 [Mycobacteriales bacterium]|nr:hypothetical protein [Mycobacteriales bacterium]
MDTPPDGAGNATGSNDDGRNGTGSNGDAGNATGSNDDGRRRTRRRRRPASPADMPEHAPQQPDAAASPADMPLHPPHGPAPHDPRDGQNGSGNGRNAHSEVEPAAGRRGDPARRTDSRPGADSTQHNSTQHDSTQHDFKPGGDSKPGHDSRPGRDSKPGHDSRPGRDSKPGRDSRQDRAERGLRGLIGAGPSQLPISAATRARDAARPTEQDLAAADELPIVRRNYVPPSGEMPH